MTEQKASQEQSQTEGETQEVGLEERFEALAAILEEMEGEGVTLERSFALYQQGLAHVKAANASLDAIEKKILVLNDEGGLEEF
jgi:exodeoxyribonuclease VII small subunit